MRLTVAGRVNDGGFWRARRAAILVAADDPEIDDLDLKPLFPAEYDMFLEAAKKVMRSAAACDLVPMPMCPLLTACGAFLAWAQALGGDAWSHTANCIVFGEGSIGYVGDADAMREWAFDRAKIVDSEPAEAYAEYARTTYRTLVAEAKDAFVSLSLTHGGQPLGQPLVFKLDVDRLPKSSAHFGALCGLGSSTSQAPYIGSRIRRIVPGGFAQGGELAEGTADEWEREQYALQMAEVQAAATAELGPRLSLVELNLTELSIRVVRQFEFQGGSADYVNPEAEAELCGEVALALAVCNRLLAEKGLSPLRIDVEGHTKYDRTLVTENYELSQRRAEHVRDDLVAKLVQLSEKEGSGSASRATLERLFVVHGFGGDKLDARRVVLRVIPPSEARTSAEGGGPDAADADPAGLPDESFMHSHTRVGMLGFANHGPHSAGTQFYVMFGPVPTMDHKYVAFGQLVDGLATLRALEAVETANEVPVQPVEIAAAGKFVLE